MLLEMHMGWGCGGKEAGLGKGGRGAARPWQPRPPPVLQAALELDVLHSYPKLREGGQAFISHINRSPDVAWLRVGMGSRKGSSPHVRATGQQHSGTSVLQG